MWKPARHVFCATLAASALAACSGYSCREPQVYQSARSVPALEVPEDLSEPEDETQLVIPRAAEDAPERDPEDPCLDQPPEYFEEEELS